MSMPAGQASPWEVARQQILSLSQIPCSLIL